MNGILHKRLRKKILDKSSCLVYNKAKTKKGAGENDNQ